MDTIYYTFAVPLGLAIGSFLNVLIYRLPRKKQFWKGRSYCPECGKRLYWYHNIPLISFVALRGRCSFCKADISLRYPLVELLAAGSLMYFLWRFGLTWQAAAAAFLGFTLIVIFFIDLEFQLIPDAITIPGMIAGLAWSLAPGGIGMIDGLIGLLVGGGALYLMALLGDWLFKKESMGGGDVKMAAMLGAFLGWQKILLVFISSAVIGLIVAGTAMAFSEKLRRERVVPFGPFIALAAILALLWGDRIISYYLNNLIGLS